MSPPPLPDDPVRGAMGILSPTSPTTDTEHTTGDCTNMTNNFLSYFSNNKLHTYFLILQPLVLRLSYGNALKIFHWYLASVCYSCFLKTLREMFDPKLKICLIILKYYILRYHASKTARKFI